MLRLHLRYIMSAESPSLYRVAALLGAVAGVLLVGYGLRQLLSTGDFLVAFWAFGVLFIALAEYARRRARRSR